MSSGYFNESPAWWTIVEEVVRSRSDVTRISVPLGAETILSGRNPTAESFKRLVSRRRTVRAFDQRGALEVAQLTEVLREMTTFNDEVSAAMNLPGVLQLRVRAERVAGLPQEWFVWQREDATLVPIPVTGSVTSGDLIPDIEGSTPAAVVSVCGDVVLAVSERGSAGYCALLAQAGMVAYRGWLAGLERGLVGGVFASVDHAVSRRLGTGDLEERHIVALVMGREK